LSNLKGFDISAWQHPAGAEIDWTKAKAAGFDFVIIKCSQGETYKNPYGLSDALAASKAGLLVGAYHFAEPSLNTAETQALYAVAACDKWPLSLGIALDLEEYGSLPSYECATWAQSFMAEVVGAGHHCPFYSGGDFMASLTGAPWGHRLWYATEDVPTGLVAWMFQDENQSVPGVEGPCDIDYLVNPRGVNPLISLEPAPVATDEVKPEQEPVSEPVGEAGESEVAKAE
jgi:GH25 family lysozyme M1 (1,4-beta-N-acetylmuramidase)